MNPPVLSSTSNGIDGAKSPRKKYSTSLSSRSIVLLALILSSTLYGIYRLATLSTDLKPEETLSAISKLFWLPYNADDFFDDEETLELCRLIERYDVEGVRKLLQTSPAVNRTGKHGVTPLLWALLHRYHRLYEPLLVHGADPDIRVREDVFLHLLSLSAGDSFSLACARNVQYEGIELALKYTKAAGQRDRDGNGIMVLYIKNTRSSGRHSPDTYLSQDLDRFLSAGIKVNDRHANGNTPIHFAFQYHVAFALLLLERGADPLLVNDEGEVALDSFFSTAKYDPESVVNKAVFRELQKQGYVDEQISLSELIRERFPDWTVPPKFSEFKNERDIGIMQTPISLWPRYRNYTTPTSDSLIHCLVDC